MLSTTMSEIRPSIVDTIVKPKEIASSKTEEKYSL